MIKNYILTTLRNISRRKGFSFLNVVGLSIGLAACLLILQYVKDELSFDDFHTKADTIYRVEIGAAVFLVSALLTTLIALATVSYQSLTAAVTNPVKSLRYE